MEQARCAEYCGFTHVAVHDHLGAAFAPIPVLTAVAMATERLGLVPLVLNNDLRHPTVLAQELASLDHLSNGRLTGALGAGWNESEYAASGMQHDPPSVRIARMAESIAALRGPFGPGPFTFHGRSYDIENMDGQPKPLQQRHPPFLVGGTREHVLRLAARIADIVGLDLRQNREQIAAAFPDRMDERVGWIRYAAGSLAADLELSVLRVLGPITITDHAREAAADLANDYKQRTGLHVALDDLQASPYSLIGDSGAGDQAARGARALGHQLVPARLGSTNTRSGNWPRCSRGRGIAGFDLRLVGRPDPVS